MAADFTMKANDRLPSIEATLGFAGSATVPNLTGATVNFVMKKTSGATTTKVNSPAVIVDVATAKVRYDWAAADTNTPGNYHAEWEVIFADGKTQTFPTLTYHTIDILADLDAAP